MKVIQERIIISRCLIFGGNGFLGSHLAEGLLSKGHEVIVFDHFKRDSINLNSIIDDITIIKGEFTDEEAISNSISDVDYVFHYISTTTPATAIHNPVYDIESNVIPTVKMLQLAAKSGVKKIIFPSSGGTIYGEVKKIPINESSPLNPQNPYAISKLAIEKYLDYFYKDYGLDYLIVRYSNPYGERQNPKGTQGVIPIFLNKIKYGERPVIYGDGKSLRDYIYIKDAIEATLLLMDNNNKERIYNVGSGIGTSLNDLISAMQDVTGHLVSPRYVPNDRGYLNKTVLDISKIKKSVMWNPQVSISEGIKRTWDWIYTNSEKEKNE